MFSSSQSLPRASLSSMPVEVKTKIARLCAQQDAHYKKWRKVYGAYNKPARVEPMLERLDRFYGKTVGTMYQLNKEWSNIMAPFVFKSVSTSSAVEPVFRYSLASARASHFTDVSLVGGQESEVQYLFSLLRTFIRLHTLELDGDTICALFDNYPLLLRHDLPFPRNPRFFESLTLQIIAPKIKNLRLINLSTQFACALLPRFVNVESIELVGISSIIEIGRTRQLSFFDRLRQLEQLRELVWTFPNHDDIDIAGRIVTSTDFPAVTRLSIKTCRPSSWDFLDNLPLSIQELSITQLGYMFEDDVTEEADAPWPRPRLDASTTYPNLDALRLVGRATAIDPLCRFVSGEVCPALKHLEVVMPDFEANATESAPGSALCNHPQLESLSITDPYRPSLDLELNYGTLVQENVRVRVFAPVVDVPVPHEGLIAVDRHRQSSTAKPDLQDSIRRNLDFLANLMEEAELRQDQGLYGSLAGMLASVELERVARMG